MLSFIRLKLVSSKDSLQFHKIKASALNKLRVLYPFAIRTAALTVVTLYCISIYNFSKMLWKYIFHKSSWEWNAGTCWIMLDLVFFLLVELRFRIHSNDHLPKADPEVVQSILAEVENEKSVVCIRNFVEGWFFKKKIEDLTKGDILEWMACMINNSYFNQLDQDAKVNAIHLLERLENRLGYKFKEGVSRNRKMLVMVDPVQIYHRPLFFYAAIKGLDLAGRANLWTAGFERTAEKGMVVYIKRGSDDGLPIVFFHGIGIGLSPYVRFVLAIVQQFPNRTVICYEKTSISMRLDKTLLLPDQYATKIQAHLKTEGIDEIIAVGHSLGTACLRWLDFYFPGLIAHRLFIDPICFSLWTCDIAQNFIYRSPDKIRHYLLKFFASTEAGIALYLRRYFV